MLIFFNIFTAKISGFLIFPGDIEVRHWLKISVNKISTFCISYSKAENLVGTVHQKLIIFGDDQGSFSSVSVLTLSMFDQINHLLYLLKLTKEWFQFAYILVIIERVFEDEY